MVAVSTMEGKPSSQVEGFAGVTVTVSYISRAKRTVICSNTQLRETVHIQLVLYTVDTNASLTAWLGKVEEHARRTRETAALRGQVRHHHRRCGASDEHGGGASSRDADGAVHVGIRGDGSWEAGAALTHLEAVGGRSKANRRVPGAYGRRTGGSVHLGAKTSREGRCEVEVQRSAASSTTHLLGPATAGCTGGSMGASTSGDVGFGAGSEECCHHVGVHGGGDQEHHGGRMGGGYGYGVGGDGSTAAGCSSSETSSASGVGGTIRGGHHADCAGSQSGGGGAGRGRTGRGRAEGGPHAEREATQGGGTGATGAATGATARGAFEEGARAGGHDRGDSGRDREWSTCGSSSGGPANRADASSVVGSDRGQKSKAAGKSKHAHRTGRSTVMGAATARNATSHAAGRVSWGGQQPVVTEAAESCGGQTCGEICGQGAGGSVLAGAAAGDSGVGGASTTGRGGHAPTTAGERICAQRLPAARASSESAAVAAAEAATRRRRGNCVLDRCDDQGGQGMATEWEDEGAAVGEHQARVAIGRRRNTDGVGVIYGTPARGKAGCPVGRGAVRRGDGSAVARAGGGEGGGGGGRGHRVDAEIDVRRGLPWRQHTGAMATRGREGRGHEAGLTHSERWSRRARPDSGMRRSRAELDGAASGEDAACENPVDGGRLPADYSGDDICRQRDGARASQFLTGGGPLTCAPQVAYDGGDHHIAVCAVLAGKHGTTYGGGGRPGGVGRGAVGNGGAEAKGGHLREHGWAVAERRVPRQSGSDVGIVPRVQMGGHTDIAASTRENAVQARTSLLCGHPIVTLWAAWMAMEDDNAGLVGVGFIERVTKTLAAICGNATSAIAAGTPAGIVVASSDIASVIRISRAAAAALSAAVAVAVVSFTLLTRASVARTADAAAAVALAAANTVATSTDSGSPAIGSAARSALGVAAARSTGGVNGTGSSVAVDGAAAQITGGPVNCAAVSLASIFGIARTFAGALRGQQRTAVRIRGGTATVDGTSAHGPQSAGSKALNEGVWLTVAYWNTQRLFAGWQETEASARKLSWLEAQLRARTPTVLFLMEVTGSRKTWAKKGGLRLWLQGKGYRARYVAGAADTNGIVVAVDESRARFERAVRLAERVVGVEVRAAADGRVRRMVCMHGLNKESEAKCFDAEDTPMRKCHALQLAEAREWVRTTGGLVGGDFNRVACRQWRDSNKALTDDDLRMRDLTGWRCSCCVEAGESPTVCGLVGTPMWTRWKTKKGELGVPTAKIDYVVAVGNELGHWQRLYCEPPVAQERDGRLLTCSDHAFIEVGRLVAQHTLLDKRREVPVPIAKSKGGGRARELYQDATARDATVFAARGEEAADAAEAAGGTRTAAWRQLLVDTGWAAVREAEAERRAPEATARQGDRSGSTPKQRVECWTVRLREAMRLKQAGARPEHVPWGPLRVGSKKVKRLIREAMGQCKAEPWRQVERCCRRELRRAQRALRLQERREDSLLIEAAKGAGKMHDAAKCMQQVWRALRARRGSSAMDKIWEGDRKPPEGEEGREKKCVHWTDPRFKSELRRIGEACVRKMADTPACVAAYRAWCDVFMTKYDTLRGTDGSDFKLARELTWEVFQEVMRMMPSGKAVGAGGFTVELLRAAGEEVQRAFYKALLADLLQQRVPQEWRVVLYALLEKPRPNDPEIVGERREIALMAHDMKMALQMVRRVSYQRIAGRIMAEQAGWLSGFGCTDPGYVAARAIQQSRRLRRDLWLLYIDLATFFPRIDREVMTVAEAVHGLPREVTDITLLIFGSADDPENAVQCFYDSAAGLGEGFSNWMGALMGCVLSPDKAKLLLNSVLVAIKAVCRGVRLWGYGADDAAAALKEVCQMAFADDWLGAFDSEKELRKAWAVWRVWEAASGSKLGARQRGPRVGADKMKTAVTGVRYAEGVARDIEDPLLRMRDGTYVPFIRCDEYYKHLGNKRAANGDERAAWCALKKEKFEPALQRLKRMRKPSLHDFISVSNALLGGLASYYLQTVYITFAEAEEVESRWRAIYRTHFGRRTVEAWSKPRLYYYEPKGRGRVRREHIWATGLAAIVACTNAAIADVSCTPQRAAARSAVALAMERWGCREDPARWKYDHLLDDIEKSLARARCRDLGDAWLLATARLEAEHRAKWHEEEDIVSKWTRDFGAEKRQRCGRWEGEREWGDPLHPAAQHWQPPRSAMISEPGANGGLGLPAEPWLLEAGVVCIGHMCREVSSGDGVEWAWITNFDTARKRNPRLMPHGAVAAAWKRQLDRLRDSGIAPVEAEAVGSGGVKLEGLHAWKPRQVEETGTVDLDAVESMLRSLDLQEVRERRSCQSWGRQLRRCFPDVQPRETDAWHTGGRDRDREARGARMVCMLDGAQEKATGGQGRWMREADVDMAGHADDAAAVENTLLNQMSFDNLGYAVNSATGDRYEGEALAGLPPAQQLQARAAARVLACQQCVVIDEAVPRKRKGVHINLAVQRRNRIVMAKVQARYRITAAYALDGTRQTVKPSQGEALFVVARAAVRHDGMVIRGRLHEEEGADNYIAEMAALMDAALAEDAGGRLLFVVDATSPPAALMRFRRMHDRARQGYYVDGWLSTLRRLLDRHEVVVFLWQTSHVGSPANEMADIEADGAAKDEAVLEVPRLQADHASMQFTMPRRSTAKWARQMGARVVRGRLREAVKESAVHEKADVPALVLPDDVQQTCEAVLSQRSCIGDERRRMGQARWAAVGLGACPFGCMEDGRVARFTWLHAQLICNHGQLPELRAKWLESMRDAAELMDRPVLTAGKGMPHTQLANCIRCIEQPRMVRGGGAASYHAREIRRVTGGLIRSTGCDDKDRSATVQAALREMVVAGAAVQQKAHEVTADVEQAGAETVQRLGKARRWAVTWRNVTARGGPARAAALREVHSAAAAAQDWILSAAAEGRMEVGAAEAALEKLLTSGDPRRIVQGSVVAAAIMAARRLHRRLGGSAFCAWRHLALLQRWRLRAALRRRRWDGVDTDAETIQVLADGAAGATTTNAVATQMLRQVTGRHVVVPVGVPPVRWQESPQPDGARVEGRSLMEAEQAAHGWWMVGGGKKADTRRAKERRDRLERIRIAAAHQRFSAFMRQDGATVARGTVGLSGKPLAPVGARFVHSFAPRGKRRRKDKVDDGVDSEEDAEIRRFERGAGANQRGQWSVDKILEVRRVYPVAGDGRRRYLEARVRWKGSDPATGAPWADSWNRLSETTSDGTVVHLLNAAARAEARLLERTKYGVTVLERARAAKRRREPTTEHAADDERWTRRWSVIRSRAGSANANAGRMQRRVVVEEDESDG